MKNIVLCGSMKVKDRLVEVAEELQNMGYHVLLPKECMEGLPKEYASFKHFERIVAEENTYVLVVNAEKNGIKNYIGPNSFAEIAFSFYFHKKTYVLYDIYEPYADELSAWGVCALHGDLQGIQ